MTKRLWVVMLAAGTIGMAGLSTSVKADSNDDDGPRRPKPAAQDRNDNNRGHANRGDDDQGRPGPHRPRPGVGWGTGGPFGPPPRPEADHKEAGRKEGPGRADPGGPNPQMARIEGQIQQLRQEVSRLAKAVGANEAHVTAQHAQPEHARPGRRTQSASSSRRGEANSHQRFGGRHFGSQMFHRYGRGQGGQGALSGQRAFAGHGHRFGHHRMAGSAQGARPGQASFGRQRFGMGAGPFGQRHSGQSFQGRQGFGHGPFGSQMMRRQNLGARGDSSGHLGLLGRRSASASQHQQGAFGRGGAHRGGEMNWEALRQQFQEMMRQHSQERNARKAAPNERDGNRRDDHGSAQWQGHGNTNRGGQVDWEAIRQHIQQMMEQRAQGRDGGKAAPNHRDSNRRDGRNGAQWQGHGNTSRDGGKTDGHRENHESHGHDED